METQSKEVRLVNHTYFLKDIQKRIDDIKVGDILEAFIMEQVQPD
jgi:hypothetical protein